MDKKSSTNSKSKVEVVNKDASKAPEVEKYLKQKTIKALEDMDQLEKEIAEIEAQEAK